MTDKKESMVEQNADIRGQVINCGKQVNYPASLMQESLWSTINTDNAIVYNLPFYIDFNGGLDLTRLNWAVDTIIKRHPALRTILKIVDGRTVQCELTDVSVEKSWREISEAKLKQAMKDFVRPFDTQQQQTLIRIQVLRINDRRHVMLWDAHHSIIDGLSIKIICSELAALLGDETLPELTCRPYDFAIWQTENLSSGRLTYQEKFWLEQFFDNLPITEVLADYPKSANKSFAGLSFCQKLPAELVSAISAAEARLGVSLFTVTAAAYATLLSRYSYQEDVIFAAPFAGRSRPELSGVVGMLANMLPIRVQPTGEKTVAQLFQEVSEWVKRAQNNQDYPFQQLAKVLKATDSAGRPTLANYFFAVRNNSKAEHINSDLCFHADIFQIDVAKTDINCNLAVRPDGWWWEFEFNAKLFKKETIERMAANLQQILQQFCDDSEQVVANICLNDGRTKQQLLVDFNQVRAEFNANETYIDLFKKQVTAQPESLAIVSDNNKMTYRELDEASSRLASHLLNAGVSKGMLVPLMVERNHWFVVGALALLKLGAAYVPLDHDYPEKRISYIISDLNASIVLSQDNLRSLAPDFSGLWIDISSEQCYKCEQFTQMLCAVDDVAYTIYTSGSTGNPKGAMLEHRSLVNLCYSEIKYAGFTKNDNCALYSNFAFDASVGTIFPCLAAGAVLYIVPAEIRLDLYQLNDYFNANNITFVLLTTQLCEQFMQVADNKSLRLLYTGGEKLKTFVTRDYKLINLYGPTEVTVYATRFAVEKDYDNIPIGKQLDNVWAYILDKYDNLQPIGAPGELCLAGVQVSRGYLNRPELTAEKFIANPYSDNEHNKRLYRTGDLARWLPDGNIEFCGRIDFQVKIRGFRVELGEIEQRLQAHAAVQDAVVIALDDTSGNKFLAGYFTAGSELNIAKLKAFLAEELPDYMIPMFLQQLAVMPLTPNGKIDKRALPALDMSDELNAEYIAPRNEIEEKLADLWQKILGLQRVGISDNFFAIGGSSLKLTLMAVQLQELFGLRVPVSEMVKMPTVEVLAEFIVRKKNDNSELSLVPSVRCLPEADTYAASPVEERMYTLNQMEGTGSVVYNIPFVIELNGFIDTVQLSAAIDAIVARHGSLRTSFNVQDGQIKENLAATIKYKKALREIDESDLPAIIAGFIRPFSLQKAPLFHFELLRISNRRHILLFDVHHIVFDGVSHTLLLEELKLLLAGKSLQPLQFAYHDYGDWLQRLMASKLWQNQEQFWLQQFADEVPILNMVTDKPRPASKSYRGGNFTQTLPSDVCKNLRQLAQQHDCTMFVVLLAALSVLISKYSGQEDMVIGVPFSGRSRPEFESIIGMFVNTLPLRVKPEGQKKLSDYLTEIRQLSLAAIDNQDYPLDQIVNKLHLQRDASRNPLFDIVFAIRDNCDNIQVSDDLCMSSHLVGSNIAKFDLTFYVVDKADGLDIEYEYASDLFEEDSIRRMANYYGNMLASIANNTDRPLWQYSLVDKEEYKRLMYDYNNNPIALPAGMPWHEHFRRQASLTPDNVALVYKDKQYTYRQLDNVSDHLALAIREGGIVSDDVVAIILDLSAEMVVAALAVMKAGAAYLPVDVAYPQSRIDYMLNDSHTKVIVSQQSQRALASNFTGLWLDIADASWCEAQSVAVDNINNEHDLAVILYTSGSTGLPKGVMIEHINVINMCLSENRANKLTATDIVGSYASFGFDASMWANFASLLVGATVHVIPAEIKYSLNDINNYFEQHKISVSFMTTQLCEQFTELIDNKSLRILATGGEKFKQYRPTNYNVVNGYGPTEYTVYTTRFIVDKPYDNIPIGRPLANTAVYMLDKYGQLMPTGVPGELCIAGPQLSRGYLNQPAMTEQKYLPNPFACGEYDKRMYKTADWARWKADGNIEYLGRIDMQVKIRGFRIELGEIEQKLLSHEAIDDAVVIAREDNTGSKYLCAYFVANTAVDIKEVKKFLAVDLPDYMVPPYIMQLASMPVNVNGKVDKKQLPEPEVSAQSDSTEYAEPTTDGQREIAAVWQQVLGIDRVSINDNFFTIGGSSIKAISVVTKLQQKFTVTIKDLFTWQTIAELANNIKPCKENLQQKLEAVKSQVALPRTDAEKKLITAAKRAYSKKNKYYQELDYSVTRDYQQVLLTGGTGYLGAYILRSLLANGVKKIFLIVRGKDVNDAERRIQAKLEYYFGSEFWQNNRKKLAVICGNLETPNLGLASDKFNELAAKIDAIIHTAANVRHFGPYDEFYSANVQATIELLNLAKTNNKIDFHHVSTLSVANGGVTGQNLVCFSEYDADIGQKSDNVYVTTKLLAEVEVIKAREFGVNASIYRVGNIVFPYDGGKYQENFAENAFFSRLSSFINIGAIAENIEALDFTYVDKLADSIVVLAKAKALVNETYHIYNYKTVDFAVALGDKRLQLAVDVMPLPQFIDYLKHRLERVGFQDHIESVMAHLGWLDTQDDKADNTAYEIFTAKSELILNKLGFVWPTFNPLMLNPLITSALQERSLNLAKAPLLAGIENEELLKLARHGKMHSYYVGEDLLWQGEANERFHIVTQGFVEVLAAARGGWLGTIGIAKAGDFIGQEALVGNVCSSLTAEAVRKPVVTLSFSAEQMLDIIIANRRLIMNLIEQIDRRVHILERLLIQIS